MNPELRFDEYPFTIRPLSKDDGGGYLIEFPDLPGCMSDGETPEEAIHNGKDAFIAYIRCCVKYGDPVPPPSSPDRGARVPEKVNVKALRKRIKLSQSEFAQRYGLNVRTLQAWESNRSKPDRLGRAYLTVISKDPKAVEEALAR